MSSSSDNVFMIGWEYPPHNSGGLGVACQGLTEALAGSGTQIYFTLPYSHLNQVSHMNILNCADPSWGTSSETLPPFSGYVSPVVVQLSESLARDDLAALPQSLLEKRVNQYADRVSEAAEDHSSNFELVHAHDWMSYPAAMKIQEEQGKKFVAHLHSAEFDRIPNGNGSPYITHTEQEGLQRADRVIAVSYYTKRLLVREYGIAADKIDVVYNGINPLPQKTSAERPFAGNRPVIVFMGRLTMQKGGEYFIKLAEKVLRDIPEALFIVAGNGDMYHELLFKTAYDKLSTHILFSGFVRGRQKDRLLQRADVFVMPSVSEPFGIVALEAAQHNTPVIISKNAGVAEVLPGAKQIDFWDLDRMSKTISELIASPTQTQTVVQQQHQDLKKVTWKSSVEELQKVYMKAFR